MLLTISAALGAAALAFRRIDPHERREPRLALPPAQASPRDVLPQARVRIAPPPPPDAAPALAAPPVPKAAARELVAWLRRYGFTGDHPWSATDEHDGLWALYLIHCAEARVTPVAANLLGQELGRLAARRGSGIEVRQVTDYETGKRRRTTHYVVSALPEAGCEPVAAGAAPEADRRRRKAA